VLLELHCCGNAQQQLVCAFSVVVVVAVDPMRRVWLVNGWCWGKRQQQCSCAALPSSMCYVRKRCLPEHAWL
jgi:hypothetical protein